MHVLCCPAGAVNAWLPAPQPDTPTCWHSLRAVCDAAADGIVEHDDERCVAATM